MRTTSLSRADARPVSPEPTNWQPKPLGQTPTGDHPRQSTQSQTGRGSMLQRQVYRAPWRRKAASTWFKPSASKGTKDHRTRRATAAQSKPQGANGWRFAAGFLPGRVFPPLWLLLPVEG